ncbi:MAG: type III-A CRISPR-associated protein Csm2 [Promethearchaeota archaeon]
MSRHNRNYQNQNRNYNSHQNQRIQSLLTENPFKIKENIGFLNQNRRDLENSKDSIFKVDLLLSQKTKMEAIKKMSVYIVVVDKLKTSQIRKILTMINAIKFKLDTLGGNELDNELQKISSVIIYLSGRNSSVINIGNIIFQLIQKILEKQNNTEKKKMFKQVYDIIQSIIAYHKLFGGKD